MNNYELDKMRQSFDDAPLVRPPGKTVHLEGRIVSVEKRQPPRINEDMNEDTRDLVEWCEHNAKQSGDPLTVSRWLTLAIWAKCRKKYEANAEARDAEIAKLRSLLGEAADQIDYLNKNETPSIREFAARLRKESGE